MGLFVSWCPIPELSILEQWFSPPPVSFGIITRAIAINNQKPALLMDVELIWKETNYLMKNTEDHKIFIQYQILKIYWGNNI